MYSRILLATSTMLYRTLRKGDEIWSSRARASSERARTGGKGSRLARDEKVAHLASVYGYEKEVKTPVSITHQRPSDARTWPEIRLRKILADPVEDVERCSSLSACRTSNLENRQRHESRIKSLELSNSGTHCLVLLVNLNV